jgi:hypothetical protein
VLLWCEIEKVVRVKIKRQPYENDDRKGDKARTVSHRRKKGQQEHPEGNVISLSNQRKWMRECLFD